MRIIPDDQDWKIVFYVEEDGGSPVRDFLKSLDQPTQMRLRVSIERLRIENITAREPLVKKLEGRIWELRRESNTNIFRVLYFMVTGRNIILLHGFQKKTQKTPRREIETALKRMQRYVHSIGG